MSERIESMVDNIGKVVYYVWGSHVYSCQIYGVTVTSSDKYYVANDLCGDKYSFYEEDEGKKWFWTREEAEANLPQKQTDTISNGIRSFYDSELLEHAKVLLPKALDCVKGALEEGEN